MKAPAVLLAALLISVAASPAPAGEHPRWNLGRFAPAGGWHPDNGGLFHWWNPDCFPHYCGPDDYCRKPIPNLCRPGTPPPVPQTYPYVQKHQHYGH